MITKQDYLIGVLVGFLTGIFAIPTLYNLGGDFPQLRSQLLLALVPLAVPPVFAFGVWFGKFLSRWIGFFAQFGKFVAVGFMNTAIDFGILNSLNLITGISRGIEVGGVNIPGFVVAVFNAYFWNKLWVFKNRDAGESLFHDFPKFLAVALSGLLLNSGIIYTVTTYIPPIVSVEEETWLNIAKALATGLVLFWNFFGFKLIVFRAEKKFEIAP